MWKIIFLIVALSMALAQAQDKCNSCMSNWAYCVDDTKFYLCMDGKNPSKGNGEPNSCPSDQFCTNSAGICETKASIDNSAGAIKKVCTSNCGDCSNGMFTCASRTQFALCMGNGNSILSSCDEGQYCSMDLYNARQIFCAPQVVLDFYGYAVSCPSDVPVIPTLEPTTTPNPEGLRTKCIAASEKPENQNRRSFYISNDEDLGCKSYIYCEINSPDTIGILFTCKSGYYDSVSNRCVASRPSTCGRATTTTTGTASPTVTGTSTPIVTGTATPTVTATPTGTPTVTTTGTVTATGSVTATPTPTVTATRTVTVTATPTVTATVRVTPTVTATPTATATRPVTATVTPTTAQTKSST